MRSQENNLLNKVIEVLLVTDSPEFLNESRKESLRDLGLDGYDEFLETPEGLEILYSITQNEIFLQDANIDELKNKIYRRFYNNFRYTKEVEGENDVSFGFLAPVLLGLGSFIISSDLKQGVKIFKSKNSVLDVIVGGDAFITSDYQSHLKRNSQGVDVRAQVGTELFAPEDVKVIDIYGDDSSVGGLQMIIENLEGTRRWGLAHLELVSLKKGDVVKYGELMAKSGASGTSKKGNKYAPHLHLTLKVKDDEGNFIDVDPEGFEIEYEDDLVVGENILKNLGKSINNPMSIKSNVFDWEGAEDKTGTFVKFKSDYYGVRAGMKILYRDWETDRKSTRLNSSHITRSRMPSSA